MSIRPLSAQLRPLTPSSKQRPLTATPSTSGTGNDSPSVFEELEEVDEREDKEQELKRAKEAERQRLSRECIVSTRTRDGLVNSRRPLALFHNSTSMSVTDGQRACELTQSHAAQLFPQ